MNKSLTKMSFILVGLIMSLDTFYGQDLKIHGQPVSIKLNGKTEVKEILLPLRDSLDYVSIKVWALVQSGELSVEIYDPLGGNHGNFSLEGNMDAATAARLERGEAIIGDEEATGNLFRTMKNPPRGAWKAKIVTKNAIGIIKFEFTRDVVVYKKAK